MDATAKYDSLEELARTCAINTREGAVSPRDVMTPFRAECFVEYYFQSIRIVAATNNITR